MRLPIDTSRLQFLVVSAAEPLKQYEESKPRESWAPRVDTNGEVLWRVQLVALGDGEAEIIRVAVPGDRDPLGQCQGGEGRGVMVRALINLATVGRVAPLPFLGEGAKPIAWVE